MNSNYKESNSLEENSYKSFKIGNDSMDDNMAGSKISDELCLDLCHVALVDDNEIRELALTFINQIIRDENHEISTLYHNSFTYVIDECLSTGNYSLKHS